MDPAIRRESVTALVAEGVRALSLNWLALSLAMLSLVPIAQGPAVVVVVVLAVLALFAALAYGSVEPAVAELEARKLPDTSREPSLSQVADARLGQVLEEAWLLQNAASPLATGAILLGIGVLVWSVLATPDVPTGRLVGVLVGSGLLLLCGVRVALAQYGLRRHGPRPRRQRERVTVVIGGRRLLRMEGELWALRQRYLPEIRGLAAEAQTWLERAVDADSPQRPAAVQAAMAARVRQVPKVKADDYARIGLDDIRPMIEASTIEIRPSLVAPFAAVVMIGQTLTLTRREQRRTLRVARARQQLADEDPPAVPGDMVDRLVAVVGGPGTRASRLSAASEMLEKWQSVGIPPPRIILPGDG